MYTYVVKKILKHPVIALTIILGPIVAVLFIIFFIIGVLTSEESGTSCSTQSSSSSSVGASDMDVTHSMMQTAKAMWQECIHLGYNANQAAGICGQAHQEDTTLNVDEYNGGCKSCGDGGHGLFQITPSASGVDIEKWCPEHHENWRAPGAQVDCFNAKFLSHVNYKSSTKNASVTDCAYKAAQAEGGGSTKPDSNTSNREGGADWFYKKFHGLGGASDADDTSNSGSTNNSCGSSSSNDSSDSSILAYAKKWLHKIPYNMGGHASGAADLKNGKQPQSTDCSGFVDGVLAHCGYKTGSFPSTPSEGSMSCLKEVSSSQTQPGDVVIVNVGGGSGGSGHTGFLMKKWSGNSTPVINEGYYGSTGNVEIHAFSGSFQSLLSKGGKPKFYHPTK